MRPQSAETKLLKWKNECLSETGSSFHFIFNGNRYRWEIEKPLMKNEDIRGTLFRENVGKRPTVVSTFYITTDGILADSGSVINRLDESAETYG